MEALVQWQSVLNNGAGVPSQIDGSSKKTWYRIGAEMCEPLADAGASDFLDMPEWEGQNLGDNYDCRTEYGLGEKSPLRGGPREDLHMFAAVAKANGLGFHSDLVLAHRDDANHAQKSITGGYLRYSKDNNCFVDAPRIPKDNVESPTEDFAYLFGQQVSYFSGYYGDGKGDNRPGYPFRNIIPAISHLLKAFDKQGARWDNVKSLDPWLLLQICNTLKLWGVAEYWTSDIGRLLRWLDKVQWKSSLFDFPLMFELRNAFNNPGTYYMGKFQYVGLFRHAPFNAVTYCNSHDVDRSANRIVTALATAYGLIMGLEGLPCIYAKDWLDEYEGYGLGNRIKNALFSRRILGQGSTVWRWSSANVIAFERMGLNDAPGCLYAINNNYKEGVVFIGVHTKWRNQWLHDYDGHMPDVWADDNGYSVIGAVRRKDAYNRVCYAPHGWEGKKVPVWGRDTTQRFEAAGDLRLPLAAPGGKPVMRILCEVGKSISFDKLVGDDVQFGLKDEDGNDVIPRGAWKGESKRKGFHTILAHAVVPDSAYKVDVTYRAPRGL